VGRHANGEGSIYRRKDGRYEGAAYFLTPGGERKRIRVYGQSRSEVHDKLAQSKVKAQAGIPIPSRARKIGEYLDYWLREVVKPNRRPTTFARYELVVRLHLKPGLGHYTLANLTTPAVQTFLNKKLADGCSIRNVQIVREVLSAALTRAMREELILRNVARLAELPKWQRPESKHWNADEARQFLNAAKPDPLYPAFVLLTLYGLRRGEVLGIRWRDLDFVKSRVHIRQQIQRIGGELLQGPVKTQAGRRDLPLVGLLREALPTRNGHNRGPRA
jgi:integrase